MSELYAVVDAARDRRIYDLVHQALFPTCLFATDVVSPMGRNAPYLLPVEHAERLIDAWRNHGRGESWGIFLRSSEERARLRQRLRTFNQAKLPDGRIVVFRWWDPRVFRVYLPTCDASDLNQWFASVEEYVCEAEDGFGFHVYRNAGGVLSEKRLDRWNGFEPAASRQNA
jgi:hypothetical protein